MDVESSRRAKQKQSNKNLKNEKKNLFLNGSQVRSAKEMARGIGKNCFL